MRLMLVHHVKDDRGSAQDMHHYVEAARELNHEVALYGAPASPNGFQYSRDLDAADAVIFIFEWTTNLQEGDGLDLLRLVAKTPRRRRVVVDCDGKYNDAIRVLGDYNHPDADASRHWLEICDSLSDKIYQPTRHPLRPNVKPFFFHAYSASWETPLDFRSKPYGMFYVGNNWFRWRSLRRVLEAVEPIRSEIGRIGLVGNGWGEPPPWANTSLIEDAYDSDPAFLDRLNVEVMPPIRFDQVVRSMSLGVVNPVIYRPLFDHLRLVTCRTFETLAASTIPLFAQDATFVEEIFGEQALELVLPQDRPQDKILALLRRPQHYASILQGIRRQFAKEHSYAARIRELIEIVES